METGVPSVHAGDAIKASAAENPESLDDIRVRAPPQIRRPACRNQTNRHQTCFTPAYAHDECPISGLA